DRQAPPQTFRRPAAPARRDRRADLAYFFFLADFSGAGVAGAAAVAAPSYFALSRSSCRYPGHAFVILSAISAVFRSSLTSLNTAGFEARISSTLMMWKPSGVLMIGLISPAFSENAAFSISGIT